MSHLILSLDGNIGAGKSTLLGHIRNYLHDIHVVDEPVGQWTELHNNDGKNLSEDKCFQSKKISKGGVLDDAIKSNTILYPKGNEHIDHEVVIKYVPFVGDSKRALDEYTS
jgi:myo-inositol-1-phosphate synthase